MANHKHNQPTNYTTDVVQLSGVVFNVDRGEYRYPCPDPQWRTHFSGWQKAYRNWKHNGSNGPKPPEPMPYGHCMFETPANYGSVLVDFKRWDEVGEGDAVILDGRPIKISAVQTINGRLHVLSPAAEHGKVSATKNPVDQVTAFVVDYGACRAALRVSVACKLDGWDRELQKTDEGRAKLEQIIDATAEAQLSGTNVGISAYAATLLASN